MKLNPSEHVWLDFKYVCKKQENWPKINAWVCSILYFATSFGQQVSNKNLAKLSINYIIFCCVYHLIKASFIQKLKFILNSLLFTLNVNDK